MRGPELPLGHGTDDTTSFVLQPPQPQPTAQPHARPRPVPAQQQDPGAGRIVAGRYRLLDKLGHGGMGTVWRAQDETVDREVAVKEPRVPDHFPERERANAFERMRREARAAARLDHPAVVNVHDVAVVEGRPWIVIAGARPHPRRRPARGHTGRPRGRPDRPAGARRAGGGARGGRAAPGRPNKGDFTACGREVAESAIANLDIKEL